jgi:uncharacterized protein with FMN-binding domain
MKKSGSNKKVANSLVAVSCGAVLAVYTAGYARTRQAADRFEAQTVERRVASPGPGRGVAAVADVRAIERGSRRGGEFRDEGSLPHPGREPAERRGLIVSVEPSPTIEVPTIEAPSGAALSPIVEAPVLSAPVGLAPIPAPMPEPKVEAAAVAPAAPKWKDGTYYGWGTSRHGDIQAEVMIEGGRIASATISQCRTRYPCSVIDPLPPQVAQRQSPEVDYISRATQSTNAFYYAVVEALGKAK